MKRLSHSRLFFGFFIGLFSLTNLAIIADEPFRPEAGKFPPSEKAYAYKGELVFVDRIAAGVFALQEGGCSFETIRILSLCFPMASFDTTEDLLTSATFR